ELKSLNGSVLLLGATATGTNDIRPNPFDPSIDGVENHAAAIDNIISKNFLRRSDKTYEIELMIVLGIGLLFAPLMIWGKAIVSGLAVVTFLIGYYYFDMYFWFQKGIWAFMAVPCLEIMIMFITTTLYKYMTEEAEKKKVKGVFQHYLSPDVINQVLDDPENLKLGGEKKELTVFFSDVRGFTTISESLSPEKLCELMNDYFTPMTSIVLRSGGVLDKYIGDAIMAFWGAPIDLPKHPDVAVQASLEMLYALDRVREDFKKKGFPQIDIGIGLNTGPMSVGNMGSGERFTYTVMGDSVNLGSRLEGLTKEYGIKAMMSEFTHAKLTKGKFYTRDLDDIRVKGKMEPVKVFHLMRPDFLSKDSNIWEFIEIFEAGRKAYIRQDWEESKKRFHECLKIKPDDRASFLYLERVGQYMEQSPGENWDGVFTFTHK
ncbi:MAG: CHASE2 domain-containing protein, partial [Oligoflexales bacterium]|nr:CHASE2 domain-containing protein [Oligoflexales bacterium]